MSTEISKQTSITPASFDRRDVNITKAQRLILDLLHNKISENKPITRDEINSLYLQCTSNDGYKYFWRQGEVSPGVMKYGNFKTHISRINPDHVRTQARQWFAINLGSCILKGKILAIPIIED